jgi:hypothetical protein
MKKVIAFCFTLFLFLLITGKSYASNFSDTFQDADGVTLPSHNAQWDATSCSPIFILSNQAVLYNGEVRCENNDSVTNGYIEAVIDDEVNGNDHRLYFRDGNAACMFRNDLGVKIYSSTSNPDWNRQPYSLGVHTFKCEINGTTANAYIDGNLIQTLLNVTNTGSNFYIDVYRNKIYHSVNVVDYDNPTPIPTNTPTPTPTPSPTPTTVFSDDFHDANGTSLHAHNPLWSCTSAVINNNELEIGTNDWYCSLPLNIANGYIEVVEDIEDQNDGSIFHVRNGNINFANNRNHYGTEIYNGITSTYNAANEYFYGSEYSGIHTFRYEFQGDLLKTYADGSLMNVVLTSVLDRGDVNIEFYGNGNIYKSINVVDYDNPIPTNAPPAISSIPTPTPINEGNTFSSTGSFTDPDSTTWTATVDYGDQSGAQTLPLSGMNFSLSHQYIDEGTYTVTVKVTDNQGATGTGTATVTVNNATPSVGAITVSSPVIQVNGSTTASATFTDAGVKDTHTAIWDWGDSTNGTPDTTPGTVTESNGSGTVGPDSHTYTAAGVYTVKLTVTDDDGTQPGTQTFQYVSVYNPTPQGLFSAGQKYTSPAGAYPQNTSLTGEVHFGLSYKYQGTMPTGDRQFSLDFNAANLHFNATTISSLVISNGIGTLTGTGTLSGSSSTYNFLVTGSESANTIRIQIKDQSGNTIYDTQSGAADTATPTTTVTAGTVLAH